MKLAPAPQKLPYMEETSDWGPKPILRRHHSLETPIQHCPADLSLDLGLSYFIWERLPQSKSDSHMTSLIVTRIRGFYVQGSLLLADYLSLRSICGLEDDNVC